MVLHRVQTQRARSNGRDACGYWMVYSNDLQAHAALTVVNAISHVVYGMFRSSSVGMFEVVDGGLLVKIRLIDGIGSIIGLRFPSCRMYKLRCTYPKLELQKSFNDAQGIVLQ
jgi:hypothetical protein